MKKTLKKIIKLSILLIIISFPFLTITQIIGMDAFLDSFEHPESYICLQDEGNLLGVKTKELEHVIIQRASHPDFKIEDKDSIIYYDSYGDITCDKITQKNYQMNSIKQYHTINNEDQNNETIYESQN